MITNSVIVRNNGTHLEALIQKDRTGIKPINPVANAEFCTRTPYGLRLAARYRRAAGQVGLGWQAEKIKVLY